MDLYADTPSVTIGDADRPVPCITYDELNYLIKLAKKDEKLANILIVLIDGMEMEIPF